LELVKQVESTIDDEFERIADYEYMQSYGGGMFGRGGFGGGMRPGMGEMGEGYGGRGGGLF
jgi:hypothetical protein